MSSPDPSTESWLAEIAAGIAPLEPDTAAVVSELRGGGVDSPVLVLAGPFNAGKSTLLKRLCVDDGVAVPPGLVIQSEPSTTGVDEARVGGWIIRDTPGLDAHDPDHVKAAFAAASDADRTLLLLTHDLFSEDSNTADLLRALAPGTVDLVLSRVDKAVLGDTDALGAYVEAKTEDARTRAARVGHNELRVFAISADVKGRVRNHASDRSRYDRGRTWDGIDVLRESLNAPLSPVDRVRSVVRRAVRAIDDCVRRGRERAIRLEAEAATLERSNADDRAVIDTTRARERDARDALQAVLSEAAARRPASSAKARMLAAADAQLELTRRDLEDLAHGAGVSPPPWPIDLAIVDEAGVAAPKPETGPGEVDTAGAEKLLRDNAAKLGDGDGDRIKALNDALKDHEQAKDGKRTREFYADDDTPFDGIRDVREAKEERARLKRKDAGIKVALAFLDTLKEERRIAAQLRDRELAEQARQDAAVALAMQIGRILHDGTPDTPGVRSAFSDIAEQLTDRQRERSARSVELEHERDGVLTALAKLTELAVGPAA